MGLRSNRARDGSGEGEGAFVFVFGGDGRNRIAFDFKRTQCPAEGDARDCPLAYRLAVGGELYQGGFAVAALGGEIDAYCHFAGRQRLAGAGLVLVCFCFVLLTLTHKGVCSSYASYVRHPDLAGLLRACLPESSSLHNNDWCGEDTLGSISGRWGHLRC